MTLQPVVTAPPTRRLNGRTLAVALFYGAVTAWTVAGTSGLLQAMQARAEGDHGSSWLLYGAFILQTPCTMAFLVGSSFVLPPPRGKRFLRWSLIAWPTVAALQIYFWYVINSLSGGGS